MTAEAEGGKAGFSPKFGADTLGIGVLSSVGLKPEDPKENEAAEGVMGEATGVGTREAWEGGAKEKVGAPEPLEYGGGSPGTEADDFKDEEPKENTAGAPPAEGKEKVEGGAASDEGGPETGAAGAGVSSFCGA